MSTLLAEIEALLQRTPELKSHEAVSAKLRKPWLPNPGAQTDAYLSEADILLYGGRAGAGKQLDHDTLVPVSLETDPSGFKRHGDLKIGDLVYGADGSERAVIALSKEETPDKAYEITFDGGQVVVCDPRHLWLTWTAAERREAGPGTIRAAEEVVTTGFFGDYFNHSVRIWRDGTPIDRFLIGAREVTSRPMRCIQVSAPDGLYLVTKSFIPTHNSGLLIGAAFNDHHRSVILRREATELDGLIEDAKELASKVGGTFRGSPYNELRLDSGRTLKFGGVKDEQDWRKYAGRGRDLFGFDEAAEFLEVQVASLLAWLRTNIPGQRTRVILASNPPRSDEGMWIIRWFAPWLDPLFPNPAKSGELRWAVRIGEEIRWVDGPQEVEVDGEKYEAESRTFIPGLLEENIYLGPEYRKRLQNLPEPLRSQLLHGDFTAGHKDHEWQTIPSAWIKAAQQRWRDAPQQHRKMIALASDIALGGADDFAMAPLYEDAYFGPVVSRPGVNTDDPAELAAHIFLMRRDGADISVDASGGWGSGVKSHLRNQHKIECAGIIFGSKTKAKSKDGYGFRNLRAQMFWSFREALSPDSDADVKLPPDPRILAELSAPRYAIPGTEILLESKEEIRKRLGRSTDWADAIVMAWHRRNAVARRMTDGVPGLPPIPNTPEFGGNDGWMMR